MVSKREKRRQQKLLERYEYLQEVHASKLLIREMELMIQGLSHEEKMRKTALKMSRRRDTGDYIK